MAKYLTRTAILAIQDYETAEVEMPEWGGTVLVRGLTAAEVDKLGFSLATPDGDLDATLATGFRIKAVSWAIIDEEGNRLFTESDIEELGKKSHKAIDRLTDVIMELSEIGADEEEIAKNE